MAQPTVTSRPAAWAGTSGPILYKFTSTNHSNAGYRLEVEIWDSTGAAKIADAKYYANSSGSVVADVSAFLKSNMSLDNSSDLSTGDVIYPDGNWIKYYIKYQEVWSAGSEDQVTEGIGDMPALSTGVNQDYAGTGSPGSAWTLGAAPSIALSGTDTSKYLRFDFSSISGVTYTINYNIDFGVNGCNVSFNMLSASNVELNTIGTPEFDTGVASGSVDITPIGTGAYFSIRDGNGGLANTCTINSISITATSPNERRAVYGGLQIGSANDMSNYTSSTYKFLMLQSAGSAIKNEYFTFSFIGVPTAKLRVERFLNGSTLGATETAISSGFDNTIVRGRIIETGTVDKYELSIVDTAGSSVLSEVKTVNILEECQNTIMLQWRNSLSGDECFPFTYNQEQTLFYGDRKAKRLTLFADNLTLNQWETIQGLNTLGELYKTPIAEMTTSLNRTSATIGQSVYVLNADGSKTGVNVIGQPNTTNTKQKKHSAFVTIEYPELFLQ